MFGPTIPTQQFIRRFAHDNFTPFRLMSIEYSEDDTFVFNLMRQAFGGLALRVTVAWDQEERTLSLAGCTVALLSPYEYGVALQLLNDYVNVCPQWLPKLSLQEPREGDVCLSLGGCWSIKVPAYAPEETKKITWFRGLIREQIITFAYDLECAADRIYTEYQKEHQVQ